jgi:hypothetical protein
VLAVQRVKQVLEGHHTLRIGEISGDGFDVVTLSRGKLLGDNRHGFAPGDANILVPALEQGFVQTLDSKAIVGETPLVGQPLFVDIFVEARKNTASSTQ